MQAVFTFLQWAFAAYNNLSPERRKQIGQRIAQIPEVFSNLISGEPVDLTKLEPLLTSDEMEAAAEARYRELESPRDGLSTRASDSPDEPTDDDG